MIIRIQQIVTALALTSPPVGAAKILPNYRAYVLSKLAQAFFADAN
jgi:hypothetical protein